MCTSPRDKGGDRFQFGCAYDWRGLTCETFYEGMYQCHMKYFELRSTQLHFQGYLGIPFQCQLDETPITVNPFLSIFIATEYKFGFLNVLLASSPSQLPNWLSSQQSTELGKSVWCKTKKPLCFLCWLAGCFLTGTVQLSWHSSKSSFAHWGPLEVLSLAMLTSAFDPLTGFTVPHGWFRGSSTVIMGPYIVWLRKVQNYLPLKEN